MLRALKAASVFGRGHNVRRLASFGGLAAAIVPCAMIVHLVAEAVATGGDALSFDFVARHAYFAGLFALGVLWFAGTVGLGRPARERRRRCALVRADLAAPGGLLSPCTLVVANLAFFAITQIVEGIPIATGTVAVGLVVALAGSLLAALGVFHFGTSFVAAAIDCALATSPLRQAAPIYATGDRRIVASRNAALAYTLFVPNRPPPNAFQF